MPGDAASAARVRVIIRACVAAAIVATIGFFVTTHRRDEDRTEHDRTAFVADLHAAQATIAASGANAIQREEIALIQEGTIYGGDTVAGELRGDAFGAALASRPLVYVHLSLESFTSTAAIAKNAPASVKDAFVSCLVDPPASRSEKSLGARVRDAYAGTSTFEQHTSHVARLADAYAGLHVAAPAFEARVHAARDSFELAKLRQEFSRAPIAKAKQALDAAWLVAAMDESPATMGAAELDGERAHDVRVAIVDLASGAILLRLRKRLDPSGWSPAGRADYARGLDECALAVDVRAAAK